MEDVKQPYGLLSTMEPGEWTDYTKILEANLKHIIHTDRSMQNRQRYPYPTFGIRFQQPGEREEVPGCPMSRKRRLPPSF